MEDGTDCIEWLKSKAAGGEEQVVLLNSVHDWFSGASREDIMLNDLDDCGDLRAVEFIRILTPIKFYLVEKGLGDGLAC